MSSSFVRIAVVIIMSAVADGGIAQTMDPFSMIAIKGSSAIAAIYPLMRMVGFFGLLGVIGMGFFKKWNWMSVASLSGAFLALALAPNIINWLTNQASPSTYTQQILGGSITASCPNDPTKTQPNC